MTLKISVFVNVLTASIYKPTFHSKSEAVLIIFCIKKTPNNVFTLLGVILSNFFANPFP